MLTRLFLLAALAGFAFPALAQETPPAVQDAIAQEEDEDDGDDALDDILQEEDTVGQEVDAVRSGDIDDSVGVARDAEVILPEDELKKKRLIKTIQRKTFLKLGRFEAGPHLGFVANDPFLNRYILGVVAGYHLTEVFAVELDVAYSPDLGTTDWKPLTTQLVEKNRVSPDISKLIFYSNVTFGYSPIYGKVAVGTRIINFDIFGAFGMGAVRTVDDLEALQAEADDQRANATANQFHPTTNLGGGLRIVFNPNLALRLEGRSLIYIEAVQSTTLEMKNNLLLQGTVTFFFPGMQT